MASGIYHLVKIFTFQETLVIVVPARKVITLEIKTFPVKKLTVAACERVQFYSKHRLFLEVNGLKQERTTHRYLRSFSCYRNDFNFPESFLIVL